MPLYFVGQIYVSWLVLSKCFTRSDPRYVVVILFFERS